MNAVTSLHIRADATAGMGTGHVMRCLALAQAALAQGIPVRLYGRMEMPWVEARLAECAVPCTRITGPRNAVESPSSLLSLLPPTPPPGTWLVLDGYHFTLPCQQAARAAGYKLLVIDDYCHLPAYSCDALLNQNPGADSFRYCGDITTLFHGLEYALLRQEFLRAHHAALHRPRPDTPCNLLLTLGGGTATPHIERLAPLLATPLLQGRTLRVLAGAGTHEHIHRLLAHCPATIEVLEHISDMPGLLLDTDLCFTAGGSTCWELCFLNVPFLTVCIAENQKATIAALQRIYGIEPFTPQGLHRALQGAATLPPALTTACDTLQRHLNALTILNGPTNGE